MPRIRVWPSDEQGCGHYRQIFVANALMAQGADVVVESIGPTVEWDRKWVGDSPPLDFGVLGVRKPDADVVVLGRPGRRQWFEVIGHLQAQGVRVVVDVDDLFAQIPRANTAAWHFDPALSPDHNREWVARACEVADLVTVTTPALAAVYGKHGRVRVLPNLVPERYLSIVGEHEDDPVVGWSGTVNTHPHDLEVTGGGIHRALMTVPGSKFGVVGTGEGVSERLGCRVSRVTGWVPFDDYPDAVAGLDVGIVPLADLPFNRAKSALKMAEMAALGVPVVASPTPDNARLRQLGVGTLVETPQQWKKQVARLLASADLRAEMAGRGREVMATQTYELHCEQWLDAWSSVLDREMAVA